MRCDWEERRWGKDTGAGNPGLGGVRAGDDAADELSGRSDGDGAREGGEAKKVLDIAASHGF